MQAGGQLYRDCSGLQPPGLRIHRDRRGPGPGESSQTGPRTFARQAGKSIRTRGLGVTHSQCLGD